MFPTQPLSSLQRSCLSRKASGLLVPILTPYLINNLMARMNLVPSLCWSIPEVGWLNQAKTSLSFLMSEGPPPSHTCLKAAARFHRVEPEPVPPAQGADLSEKGQSPPSLQHGHAPGCTSVHTDSFLQPSSRLNQGHLANKASPSSASLLMLLWLFRSGLKSKERCCVKMKGFFQLQT